MGHILSLQVADSFNVALYLCKTHSFSLRSMLVWHLFTKLFFVVGLCLSFNDRIFQVLVCAALTSVSTYLLGRVIERTIDNRDNLTNDVFRKIDYKGRIDDEEIELKAFDLYIMLCLDLRFTWHTITGQSFPKKAQVNVKKTN